MTIRPFHLIPQPAAADPGWQAAVFFCIAAIASTIPGIAAFCFFGAIAIGGVADANAGALAAGAGMMGYIGWGFAQAAFYLRRLLGPEPNESFWWCSTFFYNLPVALGCGIWFVGEPGIASAGAMLASFAGVALAWRAWIDSDERA